MANGDVDNLDAAHDDAAQAGGAKHGHEAGPKIAIAEPRVVVLKGAGDGAAHRIGVKLGAIDDKGKSTKFDGEGELSCASANKIKVFDSKKSKTELNLPLKLTGKSLGARKTLYVEGVSKSGAIDDVELKLKLTKTGSDEVIGPNPASAKLTVLKVQIDLCEPRSSAGGDPNPLAQDKKLDPGRALHLQHEELWAGRALAIVKPAEPTGWDGNLHLEATNPGVRVFDAEVAAKGQAPVKLPHAEKNTAIPAAGKHFWVEGAKASKGLHDTGLRVRLRDLKGRPEGDRVGVTVVKLEIDICGAPKKEGKKPVPIKDKDKLDPGRFLQLQDAGNNSARALLIVRKAKPSAFAGEISLIPTDDKVGFYAAETGGALRVAANTPLDLDNSTIDAKKGEEIWVEGLKVSGALKDTGLRVKLKDAADGEHVTNDADRVALTVAEFEKIEATIPPTPANTVRAGQPAPADHAFETTKMESDFATNEPLVLMKNSSDDIALKVTVKPAGLPLLWDTPRNKDDNAKIGKKSRKPKIKQDGGDKAKAVLGSNRRGSFRVRPYINTNRGKRYNEGEPSMSLNLVLADARRIQDKSKGNKSKLTHATTPAFLSVRNGTWPAVHRNPTNADLGNAGMAMRAIVDVVGGGADGRLGLDKVFGGLINDLRNVQVDCTFVDNTAAPPTNHSLKNLYVSNPGAATAMNGTKPMFVAGDPAPALLAFPILDSGRGTSGTGADTATMTRSYPATRTNRPLGIRYDIRCIDSPGRGLNYAHPVNASARLSRITYRHQFVGFFAFWTNVTTVRTQSGDAADRLYSVVGKLTWECVGDFRMTYPAGVATLGGGATHKVKVTKKKVDPIASAEDHNVEVRPPAGITAGFAWDAR